MQWLIDESAMGAVQRAWASECTLTEAQISAVSRTPRSPLTVAEGVAQIDVRGVLTAERDPWLGLFGVASTSYREIADALAEAVSNDDVQSVVLWVDSPGGQVDGLFELLGALKAFSKPIEVTAVKATSAAYAIAAVAGPIRALVPSATFGSIGVAVSYQVRPDVVDITSTEAPNKRPDVRTPEGRAVVRANLDDNHQLFVEPIAEGRGTTVAIVNATYGRGGLVLAAEAQRLGMIDSIGPAPDRRGSANAVAEEGEKARTMKLSELKTQHPEAYAAAVAEGVAQERDRVSAHLIRGKASGKLGMETALAAIESGEAMTQVLEARYFAAGINERDLGSRASDDAAAAHALDGAAAPPTPDGADAVAAELETLIGGAQ